jgi:hypothetical protein
MELGFCMTEQTSRSSCAFLNSAVQNGLGLAEVIGRRMMIFLAAVTAGCHHSLVGLDELRREPTGWKPVPLSGHPAGPRSGGRITPGNGGKMNQRLALCRKVGFRGVTFLTDHHGSSRDRASMRQVRR